MSAVRFLLALDRGKADCVVPKCGGFFVKIWTARVSGFCGHGGQGWGSDCTWIGVDYAKTFGRGLDDDFCQKLAEAPAPERDPSPRS